MPDFLLELGTEEIPARMLDGASAELARRVGELLVRERLAANAEVQPFSTPRRLAVLVRGILVSQPDIEEAVTGPAVKIAFKDGSPTPAADAFAKKVGLSVAQLTRVNTPKGEYLAATVTRKGRTASDVLTELLPAELSAIHWPKSMYWRVKSERFVRPVRWLVALLDGQVVPLEFGGHRASSTSRGHRLLGTEIKVAKPADYAATLERSAVLADKAAREHRIRKALDAATRTVPGARWREDAALLNTVVNLTEFPSAILGNFDPTFLSLPEEVLVTVMRDHQKYFAVEDAAGKLAPHFLAVLNTDGDPQGLIRHGNERVLRARFADARFFWDTDQRTPLRERVEMLKSVTFQRDLGSYHEKTERVARFADTIAAELSNSGVKLNRDAVHEAAWLAKTDLTTELVKEFTELQGIVGGLYARAQGHSETVALAVYDHYKPESMEDSVPRTLEGAVLSLADKADTIAGMFALGMQPTGSKDPFALRRQANGIIKTIAERGLRLPISRVFASTKTKDVSAFFRERLEFYLRDVRGFAYDTVNATLAAGSDDVLDAVARAAAVAEVRKSTDFEPIAAAFKRMKNILRQAEETKKRVAEKFDAAALREKEEKALAAEMPRIRDLVEKQRAQGNYREALHEISRLRPLVDAFFDKVMVMVEDEALRANRLALLRALVQDFSTIADFSEIVTEKPTTSPERESRD
jgi:glycyl-tRNA synthetase beta chain